MNFPNVRKLIFLKAYSSHYSYGRVIENIVPLRAEQDEGICYDPSAQ